MRLLLVQRAGDFREAHSLLAETGAEQYYGHGYLLGQLAALHQEFGEVAIMCCTTRERYVERLPSGVHVMGAQAHPRKQSGIVRQMMAEWEPTHLLVLGPMTTLIRWGLSSRVRLACQFADSFEIGAFERMLRYGRLPSVLNDRRIDWVSNHGWNACRSLARIGVAPRKVLAWDWPYRRAPSEYAPRTLPTGVHTLFYAGTIQREKGVGELVRAIAALKQRGVTVRLELAGGGDLDRFRALATKLDVASQVEFLGRVSNDAVFARMRAATAVVVPSRHAYPEGFPLVIYEALCARTPLVASDHPMFAGYLVGGSTAMVFPERDAQAMADAIADLLRRPDLYARISAASDTVWAKLDNPVKWGEPVRRWLRGRPDDLAWFKVHSLAERPADLGAHPTPRRVAAGTTAQ